MADDTDGDDPLPDLPHILLKKLPSDLGARSMTECLGPSINENSSCP